LIVVNLDPFHSHESMVEVPLQALGINESDPYEVMDLLTLSRYVWRGSRNYVRLDPNERVAHVFRITPRAG
jgi:starch synthase (maltosyl-transferring)